MKLGHSIDPESDGSRVGGMPHSDGICRVISNTGDCLRHRLVTKRPHGYLEHKAISIERVRTVPNCLEVRSPRQRRVYIEGLGAVRAVQSGADDIEIVLTNEGVAGPLRGKICSLDDDPTGQRLYLG